MFYCRFVRNVKEWKRPTCRCTARAQATLTWLSQPRFLLSTAPFIFHEKHVDICSHSCFPSSLPLPELLWAGCGISEHCISLQHEIPGGDHWLAACYEPAHQPEHSLKVTDRYAATVETLAEFSAGCSPVCDACSIMSFLHQRDRWQDSLGCKYF